MPDGRPETSTGLPAAAYGRALALVGERTDLRVEPLAVLPPTGLRAALSRHLGSVRLAPGIRRVGVFLVDREVGPDLDGFASPLPVETRLVGRHGRVLEQEFAGSIPDDVNRPGELEPLSEGARFLRRFGRSSHAAICQALDVVAAEPRRARLHARDARARVVVRDSRRGFTPALVAAVAELGGWENLLDPVAVVVVKPNLHYHERYPSVTRPKALEAVLRQLLERGYRVRVVESSGPEATVSDEGLLLAGVDNLALDVWIRDYLDRRHPGWNPAAHPTVDYLTYLEAGVG